ncbi:NH3-dependent NAD(+) synthetase [Serratia symbiotica str. 'Cinara cedri']|nr:NH3-dependent NAD(+) synthetase [Serratia symbiotica str. 'Cinara cedri']
MSRSLSIVLAQLNLLVGDIEGNAERMLQIVQGYQGAGIDLIMFTELALCGYPPEDLLYRNDFYQRCIVQLQRLQQASRNVAIMVGHHWRENNKLYNALSLFSEGRVLTRYFKQQLPNYGVFDEQRYFHAGSKTCVVGLKGYRLGLLICEDLWCPELVDAAKAANAEIILSINASPYHYEQSYIRNALIIDHCQRTHLPLIYLNQIGGQDELIFDGCSKVVDAFGNITHRLASFTEHVMQLQFNDLEIIPMYAPTSELSQLSQMYSALVLAVRDYVTKNSFNGVILGLSGGIDSALTLAIAVDALGKDNVQALMMPFRYTSDISIASAREEAAILGVEFNIVSIEPIFDAFIGQLSSLFVDSNLDSTEENLQARCRGMILMALSNKRQRIVLTTGNKSEIAVGYTTLYGDMAGGFDVLKDVSKTLVFKLSIYRNDISYVIPRQVIERPPSAELVLNQCDQDSLPPYDILDAILEGYVECDKSIDDLSAAGFNEDVVRKVIHLVDVNEYKRRQAAIGPRITARNFGKGRRYPITSGFGRKNW